MKYNRFKNKKKIDSFTYSAPLFMLWKFASLGLQNKTKTKYIRLQSMILIAVSIYAVN